jgi:hypothetical protein
MGLSRKFRSATLAILFASASLHAFAGQKAAPAESHPKAEKQANRQQAQGAQPGADNRAGLNQSLAKHPAEEILSRLASMTQAEREQALSKLPPAQRARIEQRIQNFQKMPPAQQERTLEKLELLNSLPPARQTQVRRSMNQFNKLPQERKQAINRELRRMSDMSPDERTAYMNGEEVGSRFSPEEHQIMADMAEVFPHRN